MYKARAYLDSTSQLSFGKFVDVPKLPQETAAEYEARTWRERLHYTETGEVFIPAIAFKNCLRDTAKYLSLPVPGKGKSTFTKFFKSGIFVKNDSLLGIKKDDVKGQWIFVPSDGISGSGKRVHKCFPVIPQWSATVEFIIAEELITEKIFTQHIKYAGQCIGIGTYRPANGGTNGQFKLSLLEWKKLEEDDL